MGEGIIYSVLSFLLVFTVLVFFHELGHYLIARLNGVRVSVFSIGFGKEIFGRTDKAGTRWKVSVIPLGGYVKFFGDAGAASGKADDSGLSDEEKAVTFHHKRLGQRAAIVAAGPLANFLLAIIIFAGLFMFMGRPVTPADVEEVLPDSPAAAAGLQPGDRVLSANNEDVRRFEDLQQIIRMHPEQEMPLVVQRGEERLELTVTPRLEVLEDDFGNVQRIGLLGISTTAAEYEPLSPFQAVGQAVDETFNIISMTFKSLAQMFQGTRSTEELGGPIRIAQMSGQVAQQGVSALVTFTAILSVNLGLINLFPIPILDGGHLLFYACEAVLGRPLSEKAQEYGLRFGLAVVMTLMIFATWNDLSTLLFSKLFS